MIRYHEKAINAILANTVIYEAQVNLLKDQRIFGLNRNSERIPRSLLRG